MHWEAARFTNEADRLLRLDSLSTAPGELRLCFRWHQRTVPVEDEPESDSHPASAFSFNLADRMLPAILWRHKRQRKPHGKSW